MYFFIPCQLLLHLTVSYTAGNLLFLHSRSTRRGVYCFTSVRPKIFFVTFFSATIDGRNLIFGHKLHIGTPHHGKRQGYDKWALAHSSSCFQWDDEKARIVLDKNAELDFCSASSLKQQFSGTHVVLLTHIIMIHSQPVFVLAPWFCLLSG